MKRIIQVSNVSIDAGNIKKVEINADPLSYSDGYLVITLLKGKEYVFNEDLKTYELIEPKIEIYGEDYGKIASMHDYLTEQWNDYLIEAEKKNQNI